MCIRDRSIALYWVIKCCSLDGWVFGCQKTAPRVRMYSFWKVLLDEFFHVPSEGPIVDSLMPFAVVVITKFFWPKKWAIALDWSWVSNLWLDWWCWRSHWLGASTEWCIPLICRFVVDLESDREFGFPPPSPDFTEWLEEAFIASSSRCKAELEKRPRSF